MKSLVGVLFFTFLILVSCSNAESITYVGANNETLKDMVKSKEDGTVWTDEIDGDRLTVNLRQADSVSNSVRLTPDVMSVADIQGEKVYPKIKGFGSLDVSEIPENVYRVCTDFCDSLSRDLYSVESYFESKSFFSYIFFISDLEKLFFKGNVPNSNGEKNAVFDKYLIGRPYESGNELQIPIRFYKSNDFVDVVIFISTTTSKLSQIRIEY